MPRTDRLFDIMQVLRSGGVHRAQDIAKQMGVSIRTIYRDIDKLIAAGVPIEGSRGIGYSTQDHVTLPPLTLTQAELEVLNLGLAIVVEATDPDLRTAAQSLLDKIETGSSQQGVETADEWKFARSPFADTARGFSFMPLIRAAIKAKQKLAVTYNSKGNRITARVIRPLLMEYWGRVWTVTAWCEEREAFRVFRVDLIQDAQARPEMFVDEIGKRLADYAP